LMAPRWQMIASTRDTPHTQRVFSVVPINDKYPQTAL
jgi:hypothetical protein